MPDWTEPLPFEPLLVPRVWGGERLRERFAKPVPEGASIGESWEVVDREDAQSVVGGRHELNELWRDHRSEVFGARGAARDDERYPLLVKLLDAREALSVQVHPPAERCEELGGEPKSEAWLFVDADAGAYVYAGLAAGATRERFAATLEEGGDVTELLHRLDVTPGSALYLPSGRVHAIGPGCVIAEVQQSSDTTYRVWDYDRPGLDGRPRELHIEESLVSIDWDDHEPGLVDGRRIVTPYFEMTRVEVDGGGVDAAPPGEGSVVGVLSGEVACDGRVFTAGQFFLCPARAQLQLRGRGEVLQILLPD